MKAGEMELYNLEHFGSTYEELKRQLTESQATNVILMNQLTPDDILYLDIPASAKEFRDMYQNLRVEKQELEVINTTLETELHLINKGFEKVTTQCGNFKEALEVLSSILHDSDCASTAKNSYGECDCPVTIATKALGKEYKENEI